MPTIWGWLHASFVAIEICKESYLWLRVFKSFFIIFIKVFLALPLSFIMIKDDQAEFKPNSNLAQLDFQLNSNQMLIKPNQDKPQSWAQRLDSSQLNPSTSRTRFKAAPSQLGQPPTKDSCGYKELRRSPTQLRLKVPSNPIKLRGCNPFEASQVVPPFECPTNPRLWREDKREGLCKFNSFSSCLQPPYCKDLFPTCYQAQ